MSQFLCCSRTNLLHHRSGLSRQTKIPRKMWVIHVPAIKYGVVDPAPHFLCRLIQQANKILLSTTYVLQKLLEIKKKTVQQKVLFSCLFCTSGPTVLSNSGYKEGWQGILGLAINGTHLEPQRSNQKPRMNIPNKFPSDTDAFQGHTLKMKGMGTVPSKNW